MLNPRVYRAAFLPALLALVVVAFALRERPPGTASTLAPEAFDGARAGQDLGTLARELPRRRPGSAADRALARRVAARLRGLGDRQYAVTLREGPGRTVDGTRDLDLVVGVHTGLSDRRIVVLAHRDGLGSDPRGELSGTAALLELARVFSGRTLRKTLVLVSTSGGSGGGAGARDWARRVGGPVDGVIVLGDLVRGPIRAPAVVPWSQTQGRASDGLVRTVQGALSVEVGPAAGSPAARPGSVGGQWARLAVPWAAGEQAVLLGEGLPAVLVQASGERGPGADERARPARLAGYGRGVLRSLTALDATRASAPATTSALVLTDRRTLPAWAVRLLVGVLALPALLGAVDAFARARRRGEPVGMWVIWVLASAAPFLLAAAFTIAARNVGLIDAPSAPLGGEALRADGPAPLLVGAVLAVFALGWVGLRPLLLRSLGVRGRPGASGAGAATSLVLAVTVALVWLGNPFAAALLLPALHLGLLLVAPVDGLSRRAGLGVVALGALPLVLVAVVITSALGIAITFVPWALVVAVAGGHLSTAGVLAWSVLLGCLVSVLAIAGRSSGPADPGAPGPSSRREVPVRGPFTYAGPGSLGGTESALRR